jgi:hypothetical protein
MAEEAGNARLFPEVLYMRNPAVNEDEVDRSLARNLICNMEIAAPGVLSFGNHCILRARRNPYQAICATTLENWACGREVVDRHTALLLSQR